MPELPEIETVRLQLQKHLVGQTFDQVEQRHKKSLQGESEAILGKKITGIDRKGKMLIINVEKGLHLAIHFKMSGQLILVRSVKRKGERSDEEIKNRIVGGHPTEDFTGPLPSKHTRVVFYFKGGDVMYFNDQRIFGWVKILSQKQLQELPFLQKLGPEPWDITDAELFRLITKRKKAVKLVLMDQEVLSGVGNIYANDALWEARIHPTRLSKTVREEDCKRLRQAIIKVLKEGIKFGGATAADAKYIDLNGLGGHYQEHFRVYDRTDKVCLRRDGGNIKKILLGGRGTYFCPICQL